jgi:simple sugar transport system ATP-binding protein
MVDQFAASIPALPRDPVQRAIVAGLDRVTVRRREHIALAEVTLDVRGGELLGVAGVEGSGHHELLRVIAGKLTPTSGARTGPSTVGFIPEDRHREGLALDLSAAENVALAGSMHRRGMMNWAQLRIRTRELAVAYDVRGPLGGSPVRNLSGGNQQKLVLARELGSEPDLVVAESPTRGLDLKAAAEVRARLTSVRDRGAAVVVYSRDLEELLEIADRVVVVHASRVFEVPVRMEAMSRALVGISG